MKRLILAGLSAAVMIAPGMAMAGGDRDHDGRRGGHERVEGRFEGRFEGRGERHDARWDGRRDWWRGRDEWRDYRGARAGYWYAPHHGYYRIEPRFYGHRWRRGEYLPLAYRGYFVDDPYYFGLRPAPRGYVWVWCGGDLVLISRSSGLILDVVMNVY